MKISTAWTESIDGRRYEDATGNAAARCSSPESASWRQSAVPERKAARARRGPSMGQLSLKRSARVDGEAGFGPRPRTGRTGASMCPGHARDRRKFPGWVCNRPRQRIAPPMPRRNAWCGRNGPTRPKHTCRSRRPERASGQPGAGRCLGRARCSARGQRHSDL